ncbi:MAG TPA: S1/P1 Nuclease [Caulobacteraceae bacterium]|nr:S1/P1 Nuclease [Caulobacteraceae bacterium]
MGMNKLGLLFTAALLALPADRALAWGATGHRLIGEAAAAALPPDLPAFLRTPEAIADLGELDREPDRWKGGKAGDLKTLDTTTHDTMRDPAHFLDLDDGGKVLGGPALANLPATRAEYEKALRAIGADGFHAGFLPYSIVDGWQQLVKDFAYWRVLTAAIPRERDPTRRAWLERDLVRREHLILSDLGEWGHYVGDGSQPMHVSIHFNGWGASYPNPSGYTLDPVHAPFEGAFVRQYVALKDVEAAMAPLQPCTAIWDCTEHYLATTNASVVAFYEMQKAGGLNGPQPIKGRAFAIERIAAGASELRDLTVSAWEASANGTIGYPPLTVDQVVKRGVDPFDPLYGED